MIAVMSLFELNSNVITNLLHSGSFCDPAVVSFWKWLLVKTQNLAQNHIEIDCIFSTEHLLMNVDLILKSCVGSLGCRCLTSVERRF